MKPLRRLPPLNALRSFEAAARHLSFTKAANELGVTPAAIGHQVKMLEEHVGVALFQRVKRQLVLTEAGQMCLPGIRAGFERLSDAVDQISTAGRRGILSVSVAPSFASKWLLPRLDGFKARHPDIDVRIAAAMRLADFASGEVDLAIRYGAGRYPGLIAEPLIRESIVPVCAPSLLRDGAPLDQPADIASHVLLHDDSPDDDRSCPTWETWLKAAGVEGVDARRGPRFNQSALVLEAAILGQGIALAKATIAAADLAAGRVVMPFDLTLPLDLAYYIVYPEARRLMPKVEAFIAWIRAEGARRDQRRISARLLSPVSARKRA